MTEDIEIEFYGTFGSKKVIVPKELIEQDPTINLALWTAQLVIGLTVLLGFAFLGAKLMAGSPEPEYYSGQSPLASMQQFQENATTVYILGFKVTIFDVIASVFTSVLIGFGTAYYVADKAEKFQRNNIRHG